MSYICDGCGKDDKLISTKEGEYFCADCYRKINIGKCFNKSRIINLKDKWQQYNMGWNTQKDNIPKELYEIIEEVINRI